MWKARSHNMQTIRLVGARGILALMQTILANELKERDERSENSGS